MALIDKETIRKEIERRRKAQLDKDGNAKDLFCAVRLWAYADLLGILDTLPEQPVEETPEPYTGIYDEAYLQDKIAKATKSWEGVDVDKILGRQPVEGLEKEVKNYFQGLWPGMETAEQCNTDMRFTPPAIMRLARHFAEWGAEHLKK